MNDQNKKVLLDFIVNIASDVLLQNPKIPIKDKLISSLFTNIPKLSDLDINDLYPNYVPTTNQVSLTFKDKPNEFKVIARIVR